MIRSTLTIFLKIPKAGRVKSRLAAGVGLAKGIGFHRAARLHRTISSRLIRSASGLKGVHKRLGMSPIVDKGWARRLGAKSGWAFHRQVQGDLGKRMACALMACAPGPAILVGSDIPGITPNHLRLALDVLRHKDMVLGPAEDGGYWLVGVRYAKRKHLPAIFQDVAWSTSATLAQTVANAEKAGLSVGYAQVLPDLDTVEDLAAVGFSSYGPSFRARAGGA